MNMWPQSKLKTQGPGTAVGQRARLRQGIRWEGSRATEGGLDQGIERDCRAHSTIAAGHKLPGGSQIALTTGGAFLMGGGVSLPGAGMHPLHSTVAPCLYETHLVVHGTGRTPPPLS